MRKRLAAGCMTGTSLDGLDAALVEIEGAGLDMRARFIRATSRPLERVGASLRRLAEQHPMVAGEIARASRDFAELHVEVLRELAGPDQLDLACIHGQTVFHQPAGDAENAPRKGTLSWQLINPFPVARHLRCPVVYDLRSADIAAGGQGAPITPIADWILFRHLDGPVAIANLGGFCNITTFPARSQPEAGPGSIQGFDLCACNQLLDAIARTLMHADYDVDGDRAASGRAHAEALAQLERVLKAQHCGGRSLGTGDELGGWIARYAATVSAEDLAATACEGLARAISGATRGCRRLLVAGGGVRNRALMTALSSQSTSTVETTDVHGVPAAYREAAEFAVLGALCQDRVPITLPQITGVTSPAPVSGAWVIP